MRKFFFLLLLGIVSCDVSINQKNNPTDIEGAKKYALIFYSLVKEKKFNEASHFFSNEFTHKDGLEILIKVNNIIGDLDTVIFINGTSNKNVDTKNSNAQFSLNYKAAYTKDTANEEIYIELIKDSLKITGYHPKVTM